MKKLLLLIMTTLLVFSLSACNDDEVYENLVFVTVYPMQFLIEEIAGDTVKVKRVPGSTVHSESIDWSAKEIIEMYESDLLFYVNAGLDTYIEQTKDSTFEGSNAKLIDISITVDYNEVCYSHEHTDDGDEDLTGCDETQLSDDPHFWLDPVRMLQAAELVKDQLILTYPENTALFENNYTVLEVTLEKLNEDYQEMADEAVKPLIATTMLFSYYIDRYDLDIHPISTSAHSTEETADNLISFVNFAEEQSLDYIIFEKNSNSPAGDSVLSSYQVINEDAEALFMHGLGNLTVEEEDEGLSYFSIMYQNLDVLKLSTK